MTGAQLRSGSTRSRPSAAQVGSARRCGTRQFTPLTSRRWIATRRTRRCEGDDPEPLSNPKSAPQPPPEAVNSFARSHPTGMTTTSNLRSTSSTSLSRPSSPSGHPPSSHRSFRVPGRFAAAVDAPSHLGHTLEAPDLSSADPRPGVYRATDTGREGVGAAPKPSLSTVPGCARIDSPLDSLIAVVPSRPRVDPVTSPGQDPPAQHAYVAKSGLSHNGPANS
jgi:hypothetical protein